MEGYKLVKICRDFVRFETSDYIEIEIHSNGDIYMDFRYVFNTKYLDIVNYGVRLLKEYEE